MSDRSWIEVTGRKYLHIDLARRSVTTVQLQGEGIIRAGRYLIARTLLEEGVAAVDPRSPENPLIFSAGPLAGTTMSNANRLSVGCKSPLTGGIKEANTGGTFAVALGQLGIAGFTLRGVGDEWVVIHLARDGSVSFDSAAPYLGKGNYEAAALLREHYGAKVSLSLCGPVGEYQGLLAGIAFTDREGRPGRLAARGGVGAVMGSKKVKAVLADMDTMPALYDRPKFFDSAREYAARLGAHPGVRHLREYGTSAMADMLNYTGGFVVRNFRSGRLVDRTRETLTIGGEHIHPRTLDSKGNAAHSCMPGCVIQCSKIYRDERGAEIVAPIEYETIALMGANCGLTDPDEIARLSWVATDLGVDTIETGATLGVLMDCGQAEFGDLQFMQAALDDLRRGTERGRMLAEGTARVGARIGARRVPVVKRQALAGYDPRVVEVNGITMATTAQGADHTAGSMTNLDCTGKSLDELVRLSYREQCNMALADSLGICTFARAVTDADYGLIAAAINSCLGTGIDGDYLRRIGRETLQLEAKFNCAAGFGPEDDLLPCFFYDEPLPPTNRVARLAGEQVSSLMRRLVEQG